MFVEELHYLALEQSRALFYLTGTKLEQKIYACNKKLIHN